jgi:hypothetical protein
MKRNEVMREIRRRIGAALRIEPSRITVHWTDDDRPKVRIPTRMSNIAEDFDWTRLEEIVAEVMHDFERAPTRDLSDIDYAARMRARRKK